MPKPDSSMLVRARYPFQTMVTPRYTDLDPNGHINNLALASALEEGRVRMYGQLGRKIGSGLVVVSLAIDYIREALHEFDLVIYSAVTAIGRTSWQVTQLAQQNDLTVAFSNTVMLSLENGRPVMTDEWMEQLESALMGDETSGAGGKCPSPSS